MDRTETFTQYRSLLFSIAYRMLGSAQDAEDMVQETFLRWQAASGEVESPKAYLSTIITRLCIDHLRSAKVQREEYLGPWLPEPIMTETPADSAALAESLSIAFLVMLESLSPIERAVFLLHEVFAYGYDEIAGMVAKSEANCRQIVKRAKEHLVARRDLPSSRTSKMPGHLSPRVPVRRPGGERVGDEGRAARRPRFNVQREEHERLLAEFSQACFTGDINGLISLFADDITFYSDGGGKTAAALQPILGADKVARYVLGVLKKVPTGFSSVSGIVNGQPAIISYIDGQPYNVLTLDVTQGRIRAIYNVLNPDKLTQIPPLAN